VNKVKAKKWIWWAGITLAPFAPWSLKLLDRVSHVLGLGCLGHF
jgi:hypothetical protein